MSVQPHLRAHEQVPSNVDRCAGAEDHGEARIAVLRPAAADLEERARPPILSGHDVAARDKVRACFEIVELETGDPDSKSGGGVPLSVLIVSERKPAAEQRRDIGRLSGGGQE